MAEISGRQFGLSSSSGSKSSPVSSNTAPRSQFRSAASLMREAANRVGTRSEFMEPDSLRYENLTDRPAA